MQFWMFNFSENPHILYIYNVYNFRLNFWSSGYSIFSANPDIPYIYIAHNFPLNFRILDIQFFCKSRHSVHIIYRISRWISRSSGHSIFLQNQWFCTYVMHIISRWNFGVLDIQFFLQIQTFRTYIMYRISRWIYAILDINFSSNPNIPYIWCTQFPAEFAQFWTINFSANPNILYKYNVHNFLSNLCCFGCPIFRQIHTFCTYIMYTISGWIFGVPDIQFFLLIQTFRTYIMYTISHWISAFWTFNFYANPDITYI